MPSASSTIKHSLEHTCTCVSLHMPPHSARPKHTRLSSNTHRTRQPSHASSMPTASLEESKTSRASDTRTLRTLGTSWSSDSPTRKLLWLARRVSSLTARPPSTSVLRLTTASSSAVSTLVKNAWNWSGTLRWANTESWCNWDARVTGGVWMIRGASSAAMYTLLSLVAAPTLRAEDRSTDV